MAKETTEPAATEDRRAPDEDAALEQTFEDGAALDVLPEEDRRGPVVPEISDEPTAFVEGPVIEAADVEIHEAGPLAPNDALSRVFDRGDGVKVDASGSILI